MMDERTMERSIREAFCKASSFFLEAQISDAKECAEWMLRHLLGWDRTTYFLRWHEPFPPRLEKAWDSYVKRRLSGEPAQYIIGEQEFFGLKMKVDPRVLIPRPETELLVEEVLRRSTIYSDKPLHVVDLGTGSGAIAIALAVHRPNWQMTAIDLSKDTLDVAKHNAALHHVDHRIRFINGDALNAWMSGGSMADQPIDILLSNPPYINSDEIERLQIEVKAHEPRLALDGGQDGLEAYRKMNAQLKQLQANQPLPKLVALEVGYGQGRRVAELMQALYSAHQIDVMNDLAGRDRMVFAQS